MPLLKAVSELPMVPPEHAPGLKGIPNGQYLTKMGFDAGE
jgi:hypothetical protein